MKVNQPYPGTYSSSSILVLNVETAIVLDTVLEVCQHGLGHRLPDIPQHIFSVT